MRNAWILACAIGAAPAAYAQDLSFTDAIARASDGPSIDARRAAVDAADRSIGPAGALPDPQLVLAIENLPATGPDRYRLNRDEMTMQRIGVMQEMPSFAELGARRAMARAEADRADASLEVGRLEARLGAAQAWIGLHYAERRVALLEGILGEARASSEAARGRLASGASSLDETIAAEVEAARLEDRLSEAGASVHAMRAQLRRWIGAAGDEPLSDAAPLFTIDADLLRQNLRRHPALVAYQAETEVAEAELRMARAERWPDWSWELSYGRRDPALEDMASVEVRLGLPLFQAWRQGPLIDARRADLRRVGAEHDATLREHEAILEAGLAQYVALEASILRGRDVRLALARQRAEAASGAFAAGNTSTSALIASRRDALEAELDLFVLEERRALIAAALALQYGETAP